MKTIQQEIEDEDIHRIATEGVKFDAGKPQYELLPPEFLEGTAHVLTFGAEKYEARNWEKGMSWSRAFGALMRHMWAWWRGQDKDKETGMSHLWHAACCLAFLIAWEARCHGHDDRSPYSSPTNAEPPEKQFRK